MTVEVNIDRIRLKLSSNSGARGRNAERSLALAVAGNLARSISQQRYNQGTTSLDQVRVAVPRRQVNAETAARAIEKGIRAQIAMTRRQR